MQEITLTIRNQVALHARPAALFVEQANKFKSNIRVSNAGCSEVNGKSILEILSLGAGCGAVITIRAEGEDAKEAIASIRTLFEGGFGEAE